MHNVKNLDRVLLGIVNKNIKSSEEQIGLNTDLKQELDSLDFVEFIMELEMAFDINISDEDAEEFSNSDNVNIESLKVFLHEKYNIVDIKVMRKDKISKINELS